MSRDEAWLSRLEIAPLDRRKHDRAAFSCGHERLDNFLKSTAAKQADLDFTKVFVATEPPVAKIIGYYALSAHGIDIRSLPEQDQRRMPRHPTVPAIYLSTIAVDSTVQGRGLGTMLMADALKRCVAVADQAGAHFIVLDAIDDRAAQWYRRIGFYDLPAPRQEQRMLLPMAKVRKAILR
ncbi:MAG: GNAT family N-acetyltransferase [Stellaceae bacterium]